MQIRYRAEFIACWLVLKTLQLLPRPVECVLSASIARLLYSLTPRLRRVADHNLCMALPPLSTSERERICRGVYRSLGRLLAECARFPRLNQSNIGGILDYEGLEHYQAAVVRGRGVLFLTAHLGAWELGAFGHAVNGYPLAVVYRPLDNPLLDRLVNRYRSISGNKLIDKRESAREILASLARGETVGILADQNTLGEEGVFVDFFGIPASTTSGIAKIALRTGAAVVPAFCVWEEREKKFRIHFQPALEFATTGDSTRDVQAATAQMAQVIEQFVRKYPDQWLWIHRRWKTRPAGEPGLYQ